MNIRIKFAKYGTMKFIGHLDVMRFFQKVLRRAEIDIAFSEGMSPHMILSFAAPLGLGVEGMSEYADIRINTPMDAGEALERMNRVRVEGIDFLDFCPIPEGKGSKAMSLVTAADYAVRFRSGHEPWRTRECKGGAEKAAEPGWWENLWDRFLEQPAIPVTRETKKGIRQADIRPMILAVSVNAPLEESKEAADRERQLHNEANQTPVFYMRLATGSAANLKPEQVMEALGAFAGFGADPFAACVTRLELYAQTGEGLCALGEMKDSRD